MKKIVPLKGYVLVTFENDGDFKLPVEALASERNALVVEVGPLHERAGGWSGGSGSGGGVYYEPIGVSAGERIYFTDITGKLITNENGTYGFVRFSDIIGKEI